MLFGSLCISAFQALIAFASGSSSGVSNTNNSDVVIFGRVYRNEVFSPDRSKSIVFE